jgi:type IV secretion system protein VirD4
VRGELWAVTSRFRFNGFKKHRKVIAIDPFKILQQAEFQFNKPRELFRVWTINPLDYISDETLQRQRDINNLVSSLVIREGKQHTHWDDNAEILLGGMIDFILKTEKPENIHLTTLYQHFIKDENSINSLLNEMYQSGGMAQAAAAQLLKTDKEERGSIYSSTFRQIKWLMDENMQATFKQSNFDLRDFLKGDMDIFVVLPEDQIIFHQRVFRMLFATVTNLLSKAPTSELPQKEILFLLDELGQLGYCKDVERAIEILRARRSVIWAFFQSLGQIKLYEKPDIFLNAKIKQIFEIDDVETMQWLQSLIGKETILLESKSHNTSNSKQKSQIFGGSVSKGDSENIQETGVDLMPINEIRELPSDEQLVIIRGEKIIRCKKLFYYEEPYFEERFDKNPYVVKNSD